LYREGDEQLKEEKEEEVEEKEILITSYFICEKTKCI
jgi:hypothetical protein